MKIKGIMAAYPQEWLDLFQRLIKHKVTDWKNTGEDEYVPSADRFEVAEVAEADTVASIIKDPNSPVLGEKMGAYDHANQKPPGGVYAGNDGSARHVLLIDIDHPAYLIPSTTPGHSHLYVDVPGGISDEDYWLLIECLSDAGVIEEGYFKASEARGFTAARLPWVKKPPKAENEAPGPPADNLLDDIVWDDEAPL